MSSNYNVRGSDRIALAATIDPQSATTAKTSDWVSMETYDRILALVSVGAISTSGTVDAKLQQAQSSSGTNAKDFSPAKAITQLTEAGTDSNKQAKINCQADELDRAGGFTHVALVITPATAAALIYGEILGINSKIEPVTDLASVDSVV